MNEQDIRVMEHARKYLLAMAQGVNPLTGEVIPDGDLVKDPRIAKCLEYTAEKLRIFALYAGNDFKKKPPFYMTDEQKAQLKPLEGSVAIRDFFDKVNEIASTNYTVKFSHFWAYNMLYRNNIITKSGNDAQSMEVTETGKGLGFLSQKAQRKDGSEYVLLLMNENAQQFIIDHIDEVINDGIAFREKK